MRLLAEPKSFHGPKRGSGRENCGREGRGVSVNYGPCQLNTIQLHSAEASSAYNLQKFHPWSMFFRFSLILLIIIKVGVGQYHQYHHFLAVQKMGNRKMHTSPLFLSDPGVPGDRSMGSLV